MLLAPCYKRVHEICAEHFIYIFNCATNKLTSFRRIWHHTFFPKEACYRTCLALVQKKIELSVGWVSVPGLFHWYWLLAYFLHFWFVLITSYRFCLDTQASSVFCVSLRIESYIGLRPESHSIRLDTSYHEYSISYRPCMGLLYASPFP